MIARTISRIFLLPLAGEGAGQSPPDEGWRHFQDPSSASLRSAPSPASGRRGARLFAFASLLFLSFSAGLALAVTPDEMLADPKLDARAEALSAQLRCMVCQNESIDESEAPLAHDIRVLVRQKILAGDSDAQIRAFLVARYGDFILLKPPFKPETFLLWTAPILLLLAGGAAIALSFKQHKTPVPLASLSAAEREKLAAIVGDEKS
jgi:cytochrome c-type biogenesis protein CcmH